jgi:3-isopropylmalate/(R)-2-methylmalate dehydratase small subunit
MGSDQLTAIDGVAVPFEYSNVDTDTLFPVSADELARREGFGRALFARWRTDPAFILNQPVYAAAAILVAGPDFGIGSSRETAVWALTGAGYRAVIAPSFGDIFRSNCTRNRLLAATVDLVTCHALQASLKADPGATLHIDLVTSTVHKGRDSYPLGIGGFARECLIQGIDEFDLLARRQPAIDRVLAARSGRWRRTTDIVEARAPERAAPVPERAAPALERRESGR